MSSLRSLKIDEFQDFLWQLGMSTRDPSHTWSLFGANSSRKFYLEAAKVSLELWVFAVCHFKKWVKPI